MGKIGALCKTSEKSSEGDQKSKDDGTPAFYKVKGNLKPQYQMTKY